MVSPLSIRLFAQNVAKPPAHIALALFVAPIAVAKLSMLINAPIALLVKLKRNNPLANSF
jgi:hypothetical protein